MLQSSSDKADCPAPSGATVRGVGLPLLVLLALCVVPSAVFYFFAPQDLVSSLAPGTISVCLLATGLMIAGIAPSPNVTRLANYISLAGSIACAIIVHFVGSVLVGENLEIGHTLLSLPGLMLMLAGAITLAALFRQNTASLNKAVALTRLLLVGIAVLAVAGIHPLPGTWDKPVFPFSEPSHLALVLNPLLIHACVVSRGVTRIVWIIGGFALAYASESLTLLVGMIIASLICLPVRGYLTALVAVVVGVPFVDLRYFLDRLDFGAGTQNLSSLIYRQGWELVGDALERTSGWGVGFQQLGYAPFRSPSADAIYVIIKNDTNTRDGGFLLAKVVAEFGILGFVLILLYLFIAIWSALLARRVALSHTSIAPNNIVLALCVICGFSVDVFTRSLGYFSSSVVLFLTSLYTLWEFRSKSVTKSLLPAYIK